MRFMLPLAASALLAGPAVCCDDYGDSGVLPPLQAVPMPVQQQAIYYQRQAAVAIPQMQAACGSCQSGAALYQQRAFAVQRQAAVVVQQPQMYAAPVQQQAAFGYQQQYAAVARQRAVVVRQPVYAAPVAAVMRQKVYVQPVAAAVMPAYVNGGGMASGGVAARAGLAEASAGGRADVVATRRRGLFGRQVERVIIRQR